MSVCPRATASSRSCRVTSSQRQTSVLATPSPALVLAARLARLEDGDALERRQRRAQEVPDPPREDLARRVLEAGDLVQVVVVEPVVQGLPRVVEDLEVDEPARPRVDGAGHGELDAEAMAVEP